MTEYDYSPEAYEQHIAKQARIARWVDNTNGYTPANPFRPLPDVPVEHGQALTSPGPYPSQSNPAHPPASTSSYYSTGSVRRHKSSRHHRHHSHVTVNPQPPALGLPLGGGLYMGANRAQLAQPMSASSISTASISPQSQWYPYRSPTFPPSTASALYLPQFQAYPYSQQYPSLSASSSPQSSYGNNVYNHPPYSSSSIQSLPLSAPSGSPVPYLQNHNQPVVVPLNGGGFVVLPPGQQVQVISAKDYYDTERSHDTDSDYSKPSFFGSLGLGRKKTKGSSRSGSRR